MDRFHCICVQEGPLSAMNGCNKLLVSNEGAIFWVNNWKYFTYRVGGWGFCGQRKCIDIKRLDRNSTFKTIFYHQSARIVISDAIGMCTMQSMDWYILYILAYSRHPDAIRYISVLSPERFHGNLAPADTMGLLEGWSALKLSGRTIDEGVIREMAKTYNVLGGKWMLYPSSPDKSDVFWSIIAPAVVNGEISSSCVGAKIGVSTRYYRTTICVYTNDFTKDLNVKELEIAIRSLKFKCWMGFKPDIYSVLNIYGTNGHDYNVSSHLYKSVFDLRLGKSIITQRF